MLKPSLILILTFLFINLNAQTKLDNASFEGERQDATMPMGWWSCNPGTTPDILPGSWGVYLEPSEGDSFMGLITRENGEWESVGQRLSAPLEEDGCYTITMDLAHSNTYNGYNKPIKLKIWGGTTRCSKDQLLFETEAIEHTDWETYEFEFNAKGTYNYIIFEAFFGDDRIKAWKGNIMVDNVSEITRCKRA